MQVSSDLCRSLPIYIGLSWHIWRSSGLVGQDRLGHVLEPEQEGGSSAPRAGGGAFVCVCVCVCECSRACARVRGTERISTER